MYILTKFKLLPSDFNYYEINYLISNENHTDEY